MAIIDKVPTFTPSHFLPPVSRLLTLPTSTILDTLGKLCRIYTPSPPTPLISGLRKPRRKQRAIEIVPDSGYASAEDESLDRRAGIVVEEDASAIQAIRADSFERTLVIQWLTGFIKRSAAWAADEETEEREALVEDAASLLAACAGVDEPTGALTRLFEFQTKGGTAGMDRSRTIRVELNDAPISSHDHTSVGLQSWASSIVLARMLCANPANFGLNPQGHDQPFRILELGAGTGLLSTTVAKLVFDSEVEIVATDYHPDVLSNLQRNIDTNFPSVRRTPIDIQELDWQHPTTVAPFDAPFDIVLAADVIYHASHAEWIRNCVARLLARNSSSQSQHGSGGIFWLIIPVRQTGRHEGVGHTVEDVFSHAESLDGTAEAQLAIISVQDIERFDGIGRADEGGYRLFKIGWAG